MLTDVYNPLYSQRKTWIPTSPSSQQADKLMQAMNQLKGLIQAVLPQLYALTYFHSFITC